MILLSVTTFIFNDQNKNACTYFQNCKMPYHNCWVHHSTKTISNREICRSILICVHSSGKNEFDVLSF